MAKETAKKNKDKATQLTTNSWYFPRLQITVEAESYEEALKQVKNKN